MNLNKRFRITLLVTAFVCALLAQSAAPHANAAPSGSYRLYLPITFGRSYQDSIYWGALISGSTYGNSANPPWDMSSVDKFEANAQRKISILHWGTPWYESVYWPQGYYPFRTEQFEAARQRGYLSLHTWAAHDGAAGNSLNQPTFALRTIINGNHDTYIRSWATAAKNWGHPFFLRMNWEMNGYWFPWSEGVNGNLSGEYVQAWRHVHDIFTQVGANNVSWVWCPHAEFTGSLALESQYPGDAYVDWTCIDGYNWNQPWLTFSNIFGSTYNRILQIAPSKPLMIGETSSTETGNSKASWITSALTSEIPLKYPRIAAVVWMNWRVDNMDWVIESSGAAQSAFASGINSGYYSSNNFKDLNVSPIPARR